MRNHPETADAGRASGDTGNRSAQRPNIVLILADDLGYADLGCYGNEAVATPHLDRLAAHGMRFTDFHANGPMCSPTRAALLTGRYQQRTGIDNVGDVMREDEIVIARRLREEAGYACGMFGKWHVSGHDRAPEDYRERLPTRYGFAEFRGIMGGFIDPVGHRNARGQHDWWHNEELVQEDGYATRLLTEHAVRFIRRHRDRPFFVYLPLTDIHFPWMTPEDEPYFEAGEWYPDPGDPAHSRLGPYDGSDEVQAVVHRMVREVDRCTGRIVETLQDLRLAQNTLVFFTSDNGGYIHYRETNRNRISNMGPYRSQKGSLYEGGHRVPAIAWQPGRVPPGTVCRQAVMTHDLFPTMLQLARLDPPPPDSPHALDGHSLVALLRDGTRLPNRPLFWAFKDQRAVRQGDWKLFRLGKNKPELYNLRDDPGETANVADKHPETVKRLLQAITDWEATLRPTPA